MTKSRLVIILVVVIYWIMFGIYTPALSNNFLSGKVTIVLKKGLWRNSNKGISYQDITLDFVCKNNKCESEIWGFAPDFNQGEHQGNIKIRQFNNHFYLQVDIIINPDPWLFLSGKAHYQIELEKKNKKILVGDYQGTFNDKILQGTALGTIQKLYPEPLNYHESPHSQEHPRLIFRENMLPELRKKAKTKIGEKTLKKLQEIINKPVTYDGYVPNAGYHAAGQCFLSLINNNTEKANDALIVVKTAMNTSYPRLFELSPVVAGIAIAYDLCYDYWDGKAQALVTNWLSQQAQLLVTGTPDRGWNPTAWSNWNARARGAAGLAALAILNEPKQYFSQDIDIKELLTIAERNIIRYLETAIGDRAFGSEGDHYTTEPFILTLFPFFTAYRNVEGKNFVTENSNIAWLLPNYVMRIVPRDNTYPIPSYGRHRYYPGGSLFSQGIGGVPLNFLPAIMWAFEHYWGKYGDQSFGINSSLDAIFLFVNYPTHRSQQNPYKIFEKVFIDNKKGFYLFRNQWKNKNDFVASIYGKREFLSQSWSFPDGGSFRIWGLGENWAIAGKSENKPENENVILQENANQITMEPIYFQSHKDGSGIVSLESKNWLRSFAVDYSNLSGVPGLFVVFDKFDDHKNSHTWVMNTEGDIEINNNVFIIKSKDNITMKGTFITPQKVQLTYQSDNQRIVATGKGEFWIIMTVQKGKIPDFKILDHDLNSKVVIQKRVISLRDNHISLSMTSKP
jgi:hypothetical protein